MIIDQALYLDGWREADGSLTDLLAAARGRPDGFVWVGLHEPTDDEFALVTEVFELHPLAAEDAVNAHQRPKLERYDDDLFVVLKTVGYHEDEEAVDVGEILLFVGRHFVVSVRHGPHGELDGVRAELEADPGQLTHGPAAVLHAVADRVVDEYLPVLAALEEDVDQIEGEVFSDDRRSHAERIYRLKRQVQAFRRAVVPLPEALGHLAAPTGTAVREDLTPYFRDVHDHAVRAAEHLAGVDELLEAALRADLAQISIRQNEDMRKISAWVAIAALPTAVAGIYGMNFAHMPELEWRYGYFTVLGLMAVACLVLYRLFRRSGWL